MNAANRVAVGTWFSALVLGLSVSLLGTAAEAQQQYSSGGRKPKVSAVTQASYDEEADPAPDLNYQPSGVADGNVTYPRYGQGSVAQRNAQARFNSHPTSAAPAPSSRVQNSRAPSSRVPSGRAPKYVAQRPNTPTPAAEQMLLPAPDESMASRHPMDNPFDDMDMPIGGPMDGPMGGEAGCCGGGTCGNCCGGCAQQCCFLGPWLWDNFGVFGGVQGFKSPADLGTNGNFGFHAGINWAFPVFDECGIGFQVGTQGVFSDLSGTTSANNIPASSDTRSQSFTTLGLFHRPACGVGPQYGVVWDYFHDDYSRVTLDLSQIRTEISFIGCRGNEFGFWGAFHTNSKSIRDPGTQAAVAHHPYQAVDMYALFLRRNFCNGGWARVSGGFTSESEGILGADAMAPLTQYLAVNTNFNYRIPNEATDAANARQEAWGLTINLVWYPACACSRGCGGPNPYRPLFGVADNTTFMIDRQ